MAQDGLFFRRVGWIDPRSRAPVVAIVLQGVLSLIIALSGTYEQILNYVVSVDFIFFGLTAAAVFTFRRREKTDRSSREAGEAGTRIPGHPFTTAFFVAACWLIVASTIYKNPENSAIGLAIMLAGVPVYYLWRRRSLSV
jgi:APA family basic amino acid/polyamine antiporter